MISYQPVRKNRFFYANVRYDSINWSNLTEVIEAFHWKINEWYIVPANGMLKAGFDQAFALMALTCQLTDTLSQYYFGKAKSSQKVFKNFLSTKIPQFATLLPQPIDFTNPQNNTDQLETFADVFYVGFRCGILHECHVPLYGGLAGQDQLNGQMFDIDPDTCTKYNDGRDCPTVRMDPTLIFIAMKAVFDDYIKDLTNPNPMFNPLRDNFRTKFFASFGEDLSVSKL